MSVKDWNFRQKPAGVWRWLLRIPVYLFRARLGFLMGERLVLLTHRGRVSAKTYQTTVEVVVHDRNTHEYIVSSGTGPAAGWYRNISVRPTEQEPAPAGSR